MARPKKQTADYFPHYVATNSRTLFILENKYGNNGYAFWFKLLEILASTNGHFFSTKEQTDLLFLSAKVNLDENTVIEILELLASLDAIDKELWDTHKVIWCQNFVDNLSDLYAKRKVSAPKRPTFEEFPERKPPLVRVSGAENSQSKVKESKEKESKEKESKEKESKEKESKVNKSNSFSPHLTRIYKVFENEIGMLTPSMQDDFNFYLDEGLEVDLIIKAIEIASKNNKKSFSYIDAILKNWLSSNVKLLSQYSKPKNRTLNEEPITDEMRQFLEEG